MDGPSADEKQDRLTAAREIADEAGDLALDYFGRLPSLEVESKGLQDYVTDADRNVEGLIRDRIAARFPGDGVLGEEHGLTGGTSGYVWVVDPIDGTSNFVRGSNDWCVVNERRARVAATGDLSKGTTAIGYSPRTDHEGTVGLFGRLLAEKTHVYHSASGALMLAQVAAGSLLGFCEAHMNPWDCLGGLLLVEEAGGTCLGFEMDAMLGGGARVVAASPGVYDALVRVTDESYPRTT